MGAEDLWASFIALFVFFFLVMPLLGRRAETAQKKPAQRESNVLSERDTLRRVS